MPDELSLSEQHPISGLPSARPQRAARHLGARGWWSRSASLVEPFLVVLALFGLGEVLVGAGVISNPGLPLPSLILQALFNDIQGITVWGALGATIGAWALGLIIAIIVGVPLGMLLGLSRITYGATQPGLEFIRTVPSIAGLPLLILILGISFELAVVMVIAGALWPVLIQSMYGVRDVDPVARDVGRAYGLSRPQILLRIVLPHSLPYVATGIRLASLIALLLSVSESLLAGGNGIGYLIVQAENANEFPLMYARIFLLGIVGLLISLGVRAIEKRLLFWHASHQREST